MKLYLISQDEVTGYDTYDSAVVAAVDENDARLINPCSYVRGSAADGWLVHSDVGGGCSCRNSVSGWVDFDCIEKIDVKYLGETALGRGLILSSFNAG